MVLDQLDGENRNFWKNSVSLEVEQMDNYKVFRDLGKHAPVPEGYKNIRYHIIFDVKHDGRRRARLVADGHLTEIPSDSIYSGVISL